MRQMGDKGWPDDDKRSSDLRRDEVITQELEDKNARIFVKLKLIGTAALESTSIGRRWRKLRRWHAKVRRGGKREGRLSLQRVRT